MIRYAVILAVLLVGCTDVHEHQPDVNGVPPLLQRFAKKPEAGTVVAFPAVPLFQSPKGTDDTNLLSNPGFEYGQGNWAVSGPDTAVCTKTDVLFAEGRSSFQVLPSAAGDVFVSQEVTVKPRTFYSFSAFLFAPGASKAALEVRTQPEMPS